MSWLSRSLANSLKIPDSGDPPQSSGQSPPPEPVTPAHGVKEDLSELTQTLSRQFWGVASFLAPPPNPSASPSATHSDLEPYADVDGSDSPRTIAGMGHKAVSEISKIASSFVPFQSEDDREEEEEEYEEYEELNYGELDASGVTGFGAIGVTDEVLAFARNISMHPETWLDFPLLPDDDEPDSLFSYFDMSEAQIEHAMAIERLAPRLAALRIELCPILMSEGCFWKIYFVLLHPRLTKHDADLLSTPQVVEARAMLLKELQSKTKLESERHSASGSHFTLRSVPVTEIETEKHPIQLNSVDTQVIDKSVIQEELRNNVGYDHKPDISSHKLDNCDDDDDIDDDEAWFDTQEGESIILLGTEEDVSFSDLEDYDDDK